MDWNTVGELCDADYHPSFWGDVINHHLTACLFRNITMFYVAAKSTRQHQWNGHCSGCLFLWSPINIFRSHSFRCIFEIRRMQLSLPSRVACYTHVHSHIENNNRTTKNRTEPKKSNSIKCFRNKTPEKYTQMALIHPFDDRRVYYFCCCLLLFFFVSRRIAFRIVYVDMVVWMWKVWSVNLLVTLCLWLPSSTPRHPIFFVFLQACVGLHRTHTVYIWIYMRSCYRHENHKIHVCSVVSIPFFSLFSLIFNIHAVQYRKHAQT